MKPVVRVLSAAAGAGINGLLLLVPAIIVGYRPLHDLSGVAAIFGVSAAVATEMFFWSAASAPLEAASKTDLDWLNWTQGLALLTGFEIDALWRFAHPGGSPEGSLAWLVGGLVVLTLGAALRAAAIRQLGAGFTNSALPGNAALCVDRIYRWLRHPAELGLCLIAAGFAIALHVWTVAAVTLPLFLLLSIVRMSREDRGLAQMFPDTFADYRRRVRL